MCFAYYERASIAQLFMRVSIDSHLNFQLNTLVENEILPNILCHESVAEYLLLILSLRNIYILAITYFQHYFQVVIWNNPNPTRVITKTQKA